MQAAGPFRALQQWKDAQEALDHAMQHYLESTILLQSQTHNSACSVESQSVRNTLSETWINKAPIPDKHSILARAQVHLNQMRNSMIQVNSLPPELLLRIFCFVASTFRAIENQFITTPSPSHQDDYKDLIIATHVCSYWRNILISTPSFWSRFDFDTRNKIEAEYERAELYSNRARGVPQSLFIEEHVSRYFYHESFDIFQNLFRSRLDDLTQIVMLNFSSLDLVRGTISHWLQHGRPGTLRALTIQMDSKVEISEPIQSKRRDLIGRMSQMLDSIHSLSLLGVVFAWDSLIYHNLTQLHIGGIPYEVSPHIHNVLDVLSNSPRLQKLRINNMAILQCDQVSTHPVYLTELEQLELMELTYESLDVLLPMIFPQSKGLNIRITLLSIDDHVVSAINSFLGRTDVARLCAQQDLIARCLPAVPNISTLIVDLKEQPEDSCLSKFSYIEASTGVRVLRCPNLQTLHLHSGSIPIEAIQEVIETHPTIRKLWLSTCYIEPFEDELLYWLKPYVENVRFDPRLGEGATDDWTRVMI
ncbi:F-box-like, partial [Rhizoctonia solani]